MSDALKERIVKIEKVTLKTPRPREVGFNSRKGAHGVTVVDPVLRIHAEGGAVGVGWSRLDRLGAEALLGRRLNDLFRLPEGTLDRGRSADLPLWDLVL